MDVLIATHNKQKLLRYQKLLSCLDGLNVLSLDGVNITQDVEEIFEDNVQNARHKAKIYGDISGLRTIAVDEAVMTNFLPDNEQPGVYVKRFNKEKKELSEEELVEVWKNILAKYPQEDKQFIFDYAIVFYNPKTGFNDAIQVKQISYVATDISQSKSGGYPLSRVLSYKPHGRPYIELDDAIRWREDEKNFASFIAKLKDWIVT